MKQTGISGKRFVDSDKMQYVLDAAVHKTVLFVSGDTPIANAVFKTKIMFLDEHVPKYGKYC